MNNLHKYMFTYKYMLFIIFSGDLTKMVKMFFLQIEISKHLYCIHLHINILIY